MLEGPRVDSVPGLIGFSHGRVARGILSPGLPQNPYVTVLRLPKTSSVQVRHPALMAYRSWSQEAEEFLDGHADDAQGAWWDVASCVHRY